MLVCVDPGHGGSDPGAKGLYQLREYYEKDLTLQIALKLVPALRRQGFNVIITRDGDYDVALSQRARVANEAGADIFVSVHANAHFTETARGMEVLFNPARPYADANRALAQAVYDELNAAMSWYGVPGRGLKERTDLAVLNQTNMPACLVEVGFISNPFDLELMLVPDIQREIAEAIAVGVRMVAGDPGQGGEGGLGYGSRILIPFAIVGGAILAGWWYRQNYGPFKMPSWLTGSSPAPAEVSSTSEKRRPPRRRSANSRHQEATS